MMRTYITVHSIRQYESDLNSTYFEWYAEAEVLGRGYLDVLERPEAVMAGFRYLTSLKSTPRSLRAPMHSSLFNKGLYM